MMKINFKKMKKFIVFIILLLNSTLLFSQINVEEIKKNITENPQKYYYEYLEIFKKNPLKLSQEELNQLYYGSSFLKSEYSIRDFNRDYKEVWEIANKRLSKKKALKILEKAEKAYRKNPLDKKILISMVNIYDAIDEKAKAELCVLQNNTIIKIIEESGTGRNVNSPICVITAGDMISIAKPIMMAGRDFKQKNIKTDEGCILTEYSNGGTSLFVKCVDCF